jgi:hypothetical protein
LLTLATGAVTRKWHHSLPFVTHNDSYNCHIYATRKSASRQYHLQMSFILLYSCRKIGPQAVSGHSSFLMAQGDATPLVGWSTLGHINDFKIVFEALHSSSSHDATTPQFLTVSISLSQQLHSSFVWKILFLDQIFLQPSETQKHQIRNNFFLPNKISSARTLKFFICKIFKVV